MPKIITIAIFCLLASSAASSLALSERAVLLPVDQARNILKQCSRQTPDGVDGTWAVPPAVLAQLERDLPKLSAHVSNTFFSNGKSVSDPGSFYRQYVGITVRGKRFIYINAFRSTDSNMLWREKPVVVCDGGKSFWGVLYAPKTRQFSDLEFSGRF
jgi:hypothetical protein